MYPMFPMMNNWFNQYTAIQAPRFNSFQQYATQNSNSSNVLAYGGQGNLYAQMNSPFNVVNTYGAGNSLIYANGANLVANLGAGNDFFYAYNRALSNFYYPNAAQNVATGGQDVLVAQNTTSYNVLGEANWAPLAQALEDDGVRFEEVSLGYPSQYQPDLGLDSYLREILPGPQ